LALELGLVAHRLVAGPRVALEALRARPPPLRELRLGVHRPVGVAALARGVGEPLEVGRVGAAVTAATGDGRVLGRERELRLPRVIEDLLLPASRRVARAAPRRLPERIEAVAVPVVLGVALLAERDRPRLAELGRVARVAFELLV